MDAATLTTSNAPAFDPADAVVRADDVTKSFSEGSEVVPVLKGVSLAVGRGEIVVAGGAVRLRQDDAAIDPRLHHDADVRAGDRGRRGSGHRPPRRLPRVRRRSIGFVFQQYNLIPALTARENVEYALNIRRRARPGGPRGGGSRAVGSRACRTNSRSLPRDLSGGQKQRVAIARAIAGRPPVLLVDEPTANLDSQTGEQVLDLFRRLAKADNRGVLIVTHDPKVRPIADRVVTIRDGKLQ